MLAATEGGAVSIEARRQAIATAGAAIDLFEKAHVLVLTILEEIIAANEKTTGEDMSEHRKQAVTEAGGTRKYIGDERARLDALDSALKDLKGPIGQA